MWRRVAGSRDCNILSFWLILLAFMVHGHLNNHCQLTRVCVYDNVYADSSRAMIAFYCAVNVSILIIMCYFAFNLLILICLYFIKFNVSDSNCSSTNFHHELFPDHPNMTVLKVSSLNLLTDHRYTVLCLFSHHDHCLFCIETVISNCFYVCQYTHNSQLKRDITDLYFPPYI